MGEAAVWGAIGASALVVGAEVVFAFKLSRMVIGLIMASAAGTLLTMIADESAPEAYDRSAIYAGLATVAGFALSVWLTSLA